MRVIMFQEALHTLPYNLNRTPGQEHRLPPLAPGRFWRGLVLAVQPTRGEGTPGQTPGVRGSGRPSRPLCQDAGLGRLCPAFGTASVSLSFFNVSQQTVKDARSPGSASDVGPSPGTAPGTQQLAGAETVVGPHESRRRPCLRATGTGRQRGALGEQSGSVTGSQV